MTTPTISEAARRAAKTIEEEYVRSPRDGAAKRDIAAIIQTALDSAHPAPKEGEKEHLLELIQQQSKTLGIVKDSEYSLRSHLKTANELLGAENDRWVFLESLLVSIPVKFQAGRPPQYVNLSRKDIDSYRAHLNQQSK